jgi:hypothetical protein
MCLRARRPPNLDSRNPCVAARPKVYSRTCHILHLRRRAEIGPCARCQVTAAMPNFEEMASKVISARRYAGVVRSRWVLPLWMGLATSLAFGQCRWACDGYFLIAVVSLFPLSCTAPREHGAVQETAPPVPDGITATLQRSVATALLSIDRLGSRADSPLSQPVEVSVGGALVVAGWAVDPQATAPAEGVEVVINNKAYVAHYGLDRPDVAQAYQTAAYFGSGFLYSAAAKAFGTGTHSLTIRAIAKGRHAYYESTPVMFVIR